MPRLQPRIRQIKHFYIKQASVIILHHKELVKFVSVAHLNIQVINTLAKIQKLNANQKIKFNNMPVYVSTLVNINQGCRVRVRNLNLSIVARSPAD